jgi:DNA-binding SARP family transcriptional activator/Tfp pilus assembly protein PilF
MEFQVLGPIRILRDGDDVMSPGRILPTLVAVLLCRADEPVAVDTLLDVLWPDHATSDPTSRLQVSVSRLRALIGDPDRLVLEHGAYRLRVLPGELDSERFESLVDEATENLADPDRCVDLVRKALDLWRGSPYADLDAPILADDAQRLRERRLAALELRYEAELARGRHAAVIGDLTELANEHPFRERFPALLMTALYRAGRQTEALDVYRSTRDRYVDELGLDPGPELRDLEHQILAGEPIALGASTGSSTSAPKPAQLPTQPGGFVGRETEVSGLDRVLVDAIDPTPIAVISGTAGVGKTALAVRWAHHARHRFPDGQLYVDLHGYDPDQPVDPGAALAGFLRALGVDGDAMPDETAELAAQFRSLVADKRLLIVLDNANTVEQVRPLLPGSDSATVVITSRDQLAGLAIREGARGLDLDRLTDTEGHDLLRTLLGGRVDAEPDAAASLIEHCAHLPLALRIAAQLVRHRPGGTIGQVAAELADVHGRLELLDVDGDSHTAVRTVFSWSYRQLDPDTARLFRMFGVHPGHDLDPYALAALVDEPVRVVRRRVDTLLRAHLVEAGADGRLRQHDLLRAYATELTAATDTEADRDAAVDRLLTYYLATASAAMDLVDRTNRSRRPDVPPAGTDSPELLDYHTAMRWLDKEFANLVTTTTWAADGEHVHYAHRLVMTMQGYLEMNGHRRQQLATLTRLVDTLHQHGDRPAEADIWWVIGLTFYASGEFDEAASHYEAALAIRRELDDHAGQAAVLNSLAGAMYSSGHPQRSIELLQQAIALYPEHGVESLLRVQRSNLAEVQMQLGLDAEARETCLETLDLAERHQDRDLESTCRLRLAKLDIKAGQDDSAFRHARRGLHLAKNEGIQIVEGEFLYELATLLRRRDDLDEAASYLDSAYRFAIERDHRLQAARARNAQGELALEREDPRQALDHHRAALDAATGIRYELARAHAGLGDAYAALDDPDRAREHWRQAHEIYAEMGVPEADEVSAKLRA